MRPVVVQWLTTGWVMRYMVAVNDVVIPVPLARFEGRSLESEVPFQPPDLDEDLSFERGSCPA